MIKFVRIPREQLEPAANVLHHELNWVRGMRKDSKEYKLFHPRLQFLWSQIPLSERDQTGGVRPIELSTPRNHMTNSGNSAAVVRTAVEPPMPALCISTINKATLEQLQSALKTYRAQFGTADRERSTGLGEAHEALS